MGAGGGGGGRGGGRDNMWVFCRLVAQGSPSETRIYNMNNDGKLAMYVQVVYYRYDSTNGNTPVYIRYHQQLLNGRYF